MGNGYNTAYSQGLCKLESPIQRRAQGTGSPQAKLGQSPSHIHRGKWKDKSGPGIEGGMSREPAGQVGTVSRLVAVTGPRWRKIIREVDLNPPEGWFIQETRVEHLCVSSVNDIHFRGGQPGAPKD